MAMRAASPGAPRDTFRDIFLFSIKSGGKEIPLEPESSGSNERDEGAGETMRLPVVDTGIVWPAGRGKSLAVGESCSFGSGEAVLDLTDIGIFAAESAVIEADLRLFENSEWDNPKIDKQIIWKQASTKIRQVQWSMLRSDKASFNVPVDGWVIAAVLVS